MTTPTPQLAGGRYQIERPLGEGYKKRVHLARDLRLDRLVALSFLKTDGLDPEALAQLRVEAQVLARLGSHPNVVPIYDLVDEGDELYLVSEYLAGGDLRHQLGAMPEGRLLEPSAIDFARQIAAALEHAHGHGVLHRDLNPGNLWFAGSTVLKLGDFGLAVSLGRTRVVRDGLLVTAVAYMAPEQALGRPLDARTDLYSLGAVLYEMVTGRTPFLGDDAVAVLSQHIHSQPVAPRWHNRDLTVGLDALILRLLAKDPNARPESARAVSELLNSIGSSPPATPGPGPAMLTNPLDRLAAGFFVGRAQTLATLTAAAEEALTTRGRLQLLSGEPGIGKTRLAEQAMSYARLRGARTLSARCYEGDAAPPFWPWLQVLRDLEDEAGDELDAEFAALEPVLLRLRGGLGDGASSDEDEDARIWRFQLFDGVTRLLRAASRSRPMVLLLDDLHWADLSSLRLLHFLARELRDARLLVLGTARDSELAADDPRATVMGDVRREGEVLELRGLEEQDVARFVEFATGDAASPQLVAALHARTSGNPLFVTELVRLLASEGRLGETRGESLAQLTMPEGIRHVLRRRVERLSDVSREVLEAAAVLGTRFEAAALARLMDPRIADLHAVLRALAEARDARLVAEQTEGSGRWSFTHALIAETLYSGDDPVDRAALHRRAAEALESTHAADSVEGVSELAHHFLRAGPDCSTQAVRYLRDAGERALARVAHESAIDDFERALALLDTMTGETAEDGFELTRALGIARERAGEGDVARALMDRAAEMARKLGDPVALARVAIDYPQRATAFFASGLAEPQLMSLASEALAGLPEGDSSLRAMLMTRLAPGHDDRIEIAAAALTMARRLGDPVTLSQTLHTLHWTLIGPETVQQRLSLARELLGVAESTGDRRLQITALFASLACQFELVSWGEVRSGYPRLEALAEEMREPGMRWMVMLGHVMFAFLEGDLEETERRINRALEFGGRSRPGEAMMAFSVQLMLLRTEQGRLAEIEPVVRGAAGPANSMPVFRATVIFIDAELGRSDEARNGLRDLLRDTSIDLRSDGLRAMTLRCLVEACVRLEDRESAPVLYELLAPFEGQNLVLGGALVLGAAARLLGSLAHLTGHEDRSRRHFEEALELNQRMGAVPWLAHTQVEYARMLRSTGAPEDARRAAKLLGDAAEAADCHGLVRVAALAQRVSAGLESDSSDSGSPELEPARVVEVARFERHGDYWTIRYQADEVRLSNLKGLECLAHLLREPGREMHATDLVALTDGRAEPAVTLAAAAESGLSAGATPQGDTADLGLDPDAREAYRERLEALRDELEEADRFDDLGRAERAREEMEFIEAELSAAFGLGGRARPQAQTGERARKAVYNRIRAAISKIAEAHPSLGRHLQASIRTGALCVYAPEVEVDWRVS